MKTLLTILLFGLWTLATGVDTPIIKKYKITDLETYISTADHPVVVSFWATFCTPCIKEIPYLQNSVKDHQQEGVELMLVSLDRIRDFPDGIARFAREHGYHATLVWLDERDTRYFCPRIDKGWTGGMPASLFVNNKTGYRRFYDRQLTDLQVGPAIREMIAH